MTARKSIQRHQAEDYVGWGLQKLAAMPQVYAYDIVHQRVVFLPEGGKDRPLPGTPADDLRSAAQRTRDGEIHCLVSKCGPFHQIKGGSRRHSWHHPPRSDADEPRPGHAPESLWHHQAKQHFARWLRGKLPAAVVSVDERWLETPIGKVKPDVLVETSDGARIAVEIQHSAGDPKRTAEKRAAYASIGVIDWWIYAPFSATMAGRKGNRVQLISAQAEMVRSGQRFYWFHLERNELGVPFVIYPKPQPARRRADEDWNDLEKRRWYRPYGRPSWVNFRPVLLDECSIRRGHLQTWVDRTMEGNEREWAECESGLRALAREAWQRRQTAETARRARAEETEAAMAVVIQPAHEPPEPQVPVQPPAVRRPVGERRPTAIKPAASTELPRLGRRRLRDVLRSWIERLS